MWCIMKSLLEQLKKRRTQLGMKQHDMMMPVGISRQQYQRLESKGNPRLDTLELIAKDLNSEILLIPQEKLKAVKAVLEGEPIDSWPLQESKSLSDDDPWQGLLGDND